MDMSWRTGLCILTAVIAVVARAAGKAGAGPRTRGVRSSRLPEKFSLPVDGVNASLWSLNWLYCILIEPNILRVRKCSA
jgi:hypothetical protein